MSTRQENTMSWLRILNVAPVRNEAGAPRKAEMWIDGVIGGFDWFDESGVVASQFIRTVDALGLGENDEIAIRMNTPGGVVSDGVTIANYLINHKACVSIRVEGQAASIGSVIAMAASPGKLTMGLGATMFIHDPWTLVAGNADQMRKAADTLDKVRDSIIAFYRRRCTSLSDDDIKTLMRDETTMTAEDAVGWGFADDMDATLKAAACEDMSAVLAQVRAQLIPAPAGKPAGAPPAQDRSKEERPMEINLEVLAAKQPDLLASIRNEAATAAATAERERIKGVLNAVLPGHEKLINDLAFDGKTSPGDAALAVNAAEQKSRGLVLDKLRAQQPVAAPAAPTNPEEEPDGDETMPCTEEEAKAQFNKSEKIRAEFKSPSTYWAFCQVAPKTKNRK